jgi:LPXTG-motif cell wall-anchored protein
MPARSAAPAVAGIAIGLFALAVVIAVGTYFTSPVSELHDVASVARMPVPGDADVTLGARGYGLYFGMLNAPSRKALRAPKLSITIVPPEGIRDPDFVEVPHTIDVLVDRFHTVQVARIAVRGTGRYHIHVESPEESGGSFSIGELPEVLDWDRALMRLAPSLLTFLGFSLLLAIAAWLLRRRKTA